jgi:transcriptional regulator with XRE-family HTH domain
MDFHKRLRRLRREKGLSYQSIADACGVKWQTVQQWCKDGGSYPKVENLEPLASLLGTTPWYLLFGVDGTGVMKDTRDKPLLSDEAEDLISCVSRLDGLGDVARKTFALHTGLLLLSLRYEGKEDAVTGHNLLDRAEQEAKELLSRTLPAEDEHAGKK